MMPPSLGCDPARPESAGDRSAPWPRLAAMLIGVSTVKDTLLHAQRFVAGNLGGGLDHLVVFLDQPAAPEQAEVAEFLDAHQSVTCVRAGGGWWGEHRPHGLNERQCTNATVVSHLLADSPVDSPVDSTAAGEVAWVFHIDGDEVVRLDRDLLAEVPEEFAAARLVPREAVSRMTWDDEPTLFKKLLEAPDLRLLHVLGAISEPTNQAYFHGHVQGKVGVRPSKDTWLGLHHAIGAGRTPVPTYEDQRLEHFHYESYSGEEFVRKWSAMITSGPRAGFRSGRAAVADAVRTLLEKDLDPEARRGLLLALYARVAEDDVKTLQDLGLVLETDPLVGSHVPAQGSAAIDDLLRDRLGALRGADKSGFFRGTKPTAGSGGGDQKDRGKQAKQGKQDKRGRRALFGRAT